ncbi:MAG: dihydropteroate synthase [Chloroflexota bacterium]|nr:dihydropteroate synthase [Chloroflexota bacterium]
MKIIAEKINGTRSQVAKAIAERDADAIRSLAQRQAEAGSDWIDVNAGTHPDREPDDLVLLIDRVQEVTDLPLSLDSTNPTALSAAMKAVRKTPMINSISGEEYRLTGVLPLVAEHGCPTIALCMDEGGIPKTVEGHLEVARRVMDQTRRAGVPDDRVYLDPLLMTIATDTECGNLALDTMRALRAEFPAAHLTTGLSNVSFGLPMRGLINRTFLIMAVAAGLDSAIADPLDRELRPAILAAELLAGNDKHCLRYVRAYRSGQMEAKVAVAS